MIASFAGSPGYTPLTMTFTGAVTITQAMPAVTAGSDSITYTGSPLAYPGGDVTVKGAGGLSKSGGHA